eukprot:SAG22_NODE_912_length_6534_cov_2.967211_3_plen_223_part_00
MCAAFRCRSPTPLTHRSNHSCLHLGPWTDPPVAVASQLWGVVLLVAEIHLGHRRAAAGAGGLWKLVRAGKYAVLWAAWVLPSVWAFGLWVSGLWSRLDVRCWSCFNSAQPGRATIQYRLAASGVSAGLALVALGCLIWAQRQVADSANTVAAARKPSAADPGGGLQASLLTGGAGRRSAGPGRGRGLHAAAGSDRWDHARDLGAQSLHALRPRSGAAASLGH